MEVESSGSHCPECGDKLKIIEDLESKESQGHIEVSTNEVSNAIDDVFDTASKRVSNFVQSRSEEDYPNTEQIINAAISSTLFKPALFGIVAYTVLLLISMGIGTSIGPVGTTAWPLLAWGTLNLYHTNFVTVFVNGSPSSEFFYGLLRLIAPLILITASIISLKISSADRIKNATGFMIGALVFTLLVGITLASGTTPGMYGDGEIAYSVDLLEALLFMGIGIPVLFGLMGGYIPSVLSGNEGKKTTLAIAISSPFVIPIFGSLLTLWCGVSFWRKNQPKYAAGCGVLGIVTALPLIFAILYILGLGRFGGPL
ncbi:allantoate permease family MFS transporter [Haloarcula sp. Atlit-120R]|uniref:allantoate permease family MFS transporter n=1 Tax=Haloarcula sp. Atlit-120R TaxID=2282135 RepID=UPI0011C35DA9|nr:allantoate permease family MFS transporter [Haloarcula sp. Atlit-120R]